VKCSLAQRIQKAPSSNISNLKCIKAESERERERAALLYPI
jgi:hypothetical protein